MEEECKGCIYDDFEPNGKLENELIEFLELCPPCQRSHNNNTIKEDGYEIDNYRTK